MTAKSKSKPLTAPPDIWFVEYLTPHDAYHHGVKTLLHSTRSPYQSITIADTGAYGRALFLDGKIQTTERDEPLYHEPLVHVPNVLHATPSQVLILGGADGGAARESLKWHSVQRVVVVDIDQIVVDSCKQFLPSIAQGSLDDPRCDLIVADALEYIRDTTDTFDVIICDLTDPMEDSPSLDLFTLQFFKKLTARLTPKGAISIQVGPASLIESPTLMPRICATLRHVFPSVHPYHVFVPTFGSPLGMAVATKQPTELPFESTIDAILRKQVQGDLAVIDGFAFRGLFALPRATRRAIEEEVDVFTDTHTANAFGRGNLLTN